MTQKMCVIKLFFNLSNRSFYVQVGEHSLFIIKDKTAAALQEKEQLEIRHVNDIKDMQVTTLNDPKPTL